MASKSRKNEYPDLEQQLDVEAFRDSILTYFSQISDPRLKSRSTYKLEHIFFIILAAVIAGANSINQIHIFSHAKAKWIKSLIPIENIPSYGVFWWILVRIKSEFLRQLLGAWLEVLPEGVRNQVLAIDGKCLRGTNDTINPPLHLVSLFAVDSGILLTQQPIEDKSNEITAIPKILDEIDIQGAVITIDAMGCQKSIAKKICDQGADYVLALKGNAGLIYNEVLQYFAEAEEAGYQYLDHTDFSEKDLGHGRIVSRTIRCVQDTEWLPQVEEWEKLKGLIEVISEREVKGKMSVERRYYITCLDAKADKLARIIQSHWGVESAPQAHKEVLNEHKLCA